MCNMHYWAKVLTIPGIIPGIIPRTFLGTKIYENCFSKEMLFFEIIPGEHFQGEDIIPGISLGVIRNIIPTCLPNL